MVDCCPFNKVKNVSWKVERRSRFHESTRSTIHFAGFRIINIRMDSVAFLGHLFEIVERFIDVLLSPLSGSFDSQYIPSFGFNGIGTGFITPFHARQL